MRCRKPRWHLLHQRPLPNARRRPLVRSLRRRIRCRKRRQRQQRPKRRPRQGTQRRPSKRELFELFGGIYTFLLWSERACVAHPFEVHLYLLRRRLCCWCFPDFHFKEKMSGSWKVLASRCICVRNTLSGPRRKAFAVPRMLQALSPTMANTTTKFPCQVIICKRTATAASETFSGPAPLHAAWLPAWLEVCLGCPWHFVRSHFFPQPMPLPFHMQGLSWGLCFQIIKQCMVLRFFLTKQHK